MKLSTSFTSTELEVEETDAAVEECNTGTQLQSQEKNNWCWAAVTSMVSNTFARGEGLT